MQPRCYKSNLALYYVELWQKGYQTQCEGLLSQDKELLLSAASFTHTHTVLYNPHVWRSPLNLFVCVCVCLRGRVCHCSATRSLNLSGLDIMCVSHISAGRWGAAKNRQALTRINSTACSLSPFTLSRKPIIFHYHSHEPHPPPSVSALRCVWTWPHL